MTRQCTNRAVVSSLIDRLQNTGYLSDERFVESVCRSYSKRYGVVYIKKFLESHDISSETINQYLPPIAEEEVHVARHLLEKKNRQTNMTLQKKKAFLERKGFSWKTIEEVTRTTA